MANILDANGLQLNTQDELIADLEAKYKAIYGNDINIDQDTPDGQQILIYAQSNIDVLDLIRAVYNSFDPDQAVGRTLDSRVAINGIERKGATKTVTQIEVVVDRALTIYGLDQSAEDIYTIADNEGNNFQLQDTVSFASAGTYQVNFEAEEEGEILTLPNTITNQVTIVLGVTSINNPTQATTTGINEESDPELRERRKKSVSIGSQGYLEGLFGALNNLDNMSEAQVYENDSSSVNQYGMPPHSIWVIVDGTSLDADIADTIYRKRNAGATMFGDIAYNIAQVNGVVKTIRWDEVELEPLYVQMTIGSLDGVTAPRESDIKALIQTELITKSNQTVTINDISTIARKADPNIYVSTAGLSKDDSSFFPVVNNTLLKNKFSIDQADIDITVI